LLLVRPDLYYFFVASKRVAKRVISNSNAATREAASTEADNALLGFLPLTLIPQSRAANSEVKKSICSFNCAIIRALEAAIVA